MEVDDNKSGRNEKGSKSREDSANGSPSKDGLELGLGFSHSSRKSCKHCGQKGFEESEADTEIISSHL